MSTTNLECPDPKCNGMLELRYDSENFADRPWCEKSWIVDITVPTYEEQVKMFRDMGEER